MAITFLPKAVKFTADELAKSGLSGDSIAEYNRAMEKVQGTLSNDGKKASQSFAERVQKENGTTADARADMGSGGAQPGRLGG